MSDEMQFILRRDGQADLRFEGELLGKVSTSSNNAHPDYSGQAGRWRQMAIYRTKGGTLVGERIDFTQWQGESNAYAVETFDNEAALIAWFEDYPQARELFEEAGITYEEEIA